MENDIQRHIVDEATHNEESYCKTSLLNDQTWIFITESTTFNISSLCDSCIESIIRRLYMRDGQYVLA